MAIDRCGDRWKDGRRSLEGSVGVLYILLPLPSVRLAVCRERGTLRGGGGGGYGDDSAELRS